MQSTAHTERYRTPSIALHWVMLLLMVAVYACIELRELFPKGSDPRENLKALHFMLGLTVLALVALRVALRLSAPAPRIEPAPSRGQQIMSKLMHAALYVFMVGMPLAGWLYLSAKGKPVPFFGLELPALMGTPMPPSGSRKCTKRWAWPATGSSHCTPRPPCSTTM